MTKQPPPLLTKPEGSLPCLQYSAIRACREPNESSPHLPNLATEYPL